ncbi:MAG: methylenetetrahydrofolate reductase [NAD(P)H] [Candidatus Omnitrophica bacterium]|nr:methylenetetrahydrofolate reductase [NAD(P)H] [Candidatus Omnitrophota bacterium]
MKISQILKNKDQGVCFEFFPARTEKGRKSLANTIGILKDYKPLYVSMTYGAGGGGQGRTKDAVSLLLETKELEVMPHLTCLGAQCTAIKELLDEYKDKGIENIMALRGDPPQGVNDFDFTQNDFSYAIDLVKTLKAYGSFCIGVAVYPEGHIEAASLEQDMEHAKQKIDAGADFAVTQMFFDNKYYYSLMDRMHKKGIDIPVLPGILPLTDVEKVKQFASICRATIPKHIEEKMQRAIGQPQEMEKIGIDFTIEQCRQLIKNGIKRLHFFTLNKPQIITKILEAVK